MGSISTREKGQFNGVARTVREPSLTLQGQRLSPKANPKHSQKDKSPHGARDGLRHSSGSNKIAPKDELKLPVVIRVKESPDAIFAANDVRLIDLEAVTDQKLETSNSTVVEKFSSGSDGVSRKMCNHPQCRERAEEAKANAQQQQLQQPQQPQQQQTQQQQRPGAAVSRTAYNLAEKRTKAPQKRPTKSGQPRTARLPSQSSRSSTDDASRHSAAALKLRDVTQANGADQAQSPEAIRLSALRLKYIVKKLKGDNWLRVDLIKSIEHSANMLNKIYNAESRRMMNEEDELREITDQQVVPGEVKDWLTTTFTQSMTRISRRSQDRFKFRSVATAIRAGIVVDRIHRRLSSVTGLRTPEHVAQLLQDNMDSWTFDVFQVNDAGEGHSLKHIGYELLQKYDIITKFRMSSMTLDNFLGRLEQGYSKFSNPYHCLIHAADVTQTLSVIINDNQLNHWLSETEVFAVLVAAMIHDFEHTGTTNLFHINTRSEMALLYNDKAVLENHHVSSVFRFMREGNNNILSNLTTEEHKYFRTLVIEIVLCTDMSFHFQQLKNMKAILANPGEQVDKTKALSLIVHCADISHPTKSWHLHKRWTYLLVDEFFKQGDTEKLLGLPVSPLCDRETTVIPQSQIGFIDFIVDPSFQVLGDMLQRITQTAQLLQSPPQPEKPDSEKPLAVKPRRKKNSKQESRSSVGSRSSSRSSSSSSTEVFDEVIKPVEIKRPWDTFLTQNKAQWKKTSEEETRAKEEREKLETEKEESVVKEAAPSEAAPNTVAATVENTNAESEENNATENQTIESANTVSQSEESINNKPQAPATGSDSIMIEVKSRNWESIEDRSSKLGNTTTENPTGKSSSVPNGETKLTEKVVPKKNNVKVIEKVLPVDSALAERANFLPVDNNKTQSRKKVPFANKEIVQVRENAANSNVIQVREKVLSVDGSAVQGREKVLALDGSVVQGRDKVLAAGSGGEDDGDWSEEVLEFSSEENEEQAQ